MYKSKIVELEELADIISRLKAENKKVILSHGVFDLLHVGHIRHFNVAKKYGDVLITTITPDRYVNKGPHRPAFEERLRAESIAALDPVDYVAINKWSNAVETIKLLKPDVYVKGSDYANPNDDVTGGIMLEREAIEDVGGELKFTEEITFSSSKLLNTFFSVFPKDADEYLFNFSKRFTTEEVIEYIEQMKMLKILVVGEAIIDEYHYGQSIGKSGKESMIALKYLSQEKFAGGSLAIANHVSNFCDNVDLFTILGEKENQEKFIESHLNKNINRIFHYRKNSPTIVKRRYLEKSPMRKLLEFYVFNDSRLDEQQSKEINDNLQNILPDYDVVIVADFGHGMFDDNVIDVITKQSKFVGVNTQSNAGNMGYNTISKYPRADYICIDEPEIRLDGRNKEEKLEVLMQKLSKKLACNNITITRGISGCLVYSGDGFVHIPAFSGKVIDSMGAGDAFLSITTPLVSTGTPMEIVGFIGNAVGAMAVTIIGNKEPIDKISLLKYIKTIMK
jgi:rfaE bifunctional protein kinase chain/domain/rfaE bifunctional protein nucleotidyltransferase chain/domain